MEPIRINPNTSPPDKAAPSTPIVVQAGGSFPSPASQPTNAAAAAALPFWKLPQAWMIGAVIVVVIAMVAGLVWGLSSGNEKAVAKDEQPVEEELPAEVPDEEPPADENPPAIVDENPPAPVEPSDGDKKLPTPMPMPKPATEVVIPEVISSVPKPKPEKPQETTPPKTSTPAKPKPAEPKKTTTPAKPAEPPKDPFGGFNNRITLPAIVADKRSKLGSVKVPDDYFCTVHLSGGASASKDRAVLSLESAAGSERDWEVFAKTYVGSDQAVKIAHLQLKDQALWLTWTEDAVENAASPALANCKLKISAGQGTHEVFLRPAITVDALPVTYEKTDRDWELPNLPLNTKTQVELSVNVPKDFPRPRFLGSAAIPITNGETYIEFGLKPGERFLKLLIQSKLSATGINLSVTPFVQCTGQDKPVAYTEANVQKLEQNLSGAIANIDAQVKALGKASSPQKTALSKQLTSLKHAQTELGKLKSFKKDFEAQCRIHAKVMYVPDDMIAELMRTK